MGQRQPETSTRRHNHLVHNRPKPTETSLTASTASSSNNSNNKSENQKRPRRPAVPNHISDKTPASTHGKDPIIGDKETDQYFSLQECAARRDWDTIVEMIQDQHDLNQKQQSDQITDDTAATEHDNQTSAMKMMWESWSSLTFGLQACLRVDNPLLARQLIQGWITAHQDSEATKILPHDVRENEHNKDEQTIANISASWFVFSMCKRAHRQADWLDPALDLLKFHLRLQQKQKDLSELPIELYDAIFTCFLEKRQWQNSIRLLEDMELQQDENEAIRDNIPGAFAAPSTYRMVIECCVRAGQIDRAYQILMNAIARANRDMTFVPTLYSFELVIGALCGNPSQYMRGSTKDKHGQRQKQRPSQWRKALQLVTQLELLQQKQNPRSTTKIPNMTLSGICNPVLIAMCRAGEVAQAKNFLLQRMKKNGVRPNVLSYNSAISLCASSPGRYKEALELFDCCLRDPTLLDQPDIYTYTNAMRACAKGGQVRKAQSLLQAAHDKGLAVDAQAYTAVIHACAKAKRWKPALKLLDDMTRVHGIRPSEICYSAAITACGSADQWEKALQLMEQMKQQHLVPSRITYNGALTALSRAARQLVSGTAGSGGSRRISAATIASAADGLVSTSEMASQIWTKAKSVLDEMGTNGISKDGFTYSAAISCCNIAVEAIDDNDDQGDTADFKMETMTRYTDDVLDLLHEMRSGKRPLVPTMVSYTNAIVNCGKARRPECALDLFQMLKEDYEFEVKQQSKAFSSDKSRRPTSKEHRLAYNAMFLALQKAERADLVEEIWDQAMGRRNVTDSDGSDAAIGITPDTVTVTNAIEALSQESIVKRNRSIDKVYSDAAKLKIPGLPSIDFDQSGPWEIEVFQLSKPVAAAACRYALAQIRDTIVQKNGELQNSRQGLNVITVSPNDRLPQLKAEEKSSSLLLRNHIQLSLAQDFYPPVTSFPIEKGLQVKKEMIQHWAQAALKQL